MITTPLWVVITLIHLGLVSDVPLTLLTVDMHVVLARCSQSVLVPDDRLLAANT